MSHLLTNMLIRLALPLLAYLGFSTVSQAQDLNTYRPGKTYYSAMMRAPENCAMQCKGDAQCYGWNFLASRTANQGGQCQLNSTYAQPIRHPFAMSGDNHSGTIKASNVVRGTDRTTRIGTPMTRPSLIMKPAIQPAYHRPPTKNNLVSNVEPKSVRKRHFAPVQPTQNRNHPQIAPRPMLAATEQPISRPVQALAHRPHQVAIAAPAQAERQVQRQDQGAFRKQDEPDLAGLEHASMQRQARTQITPPHLTQAAHTQPNPARPQQASPLQARPLQARPQQTRPARSQPPQAPLQASVQPMPLLPPVNFGVRSPEIGKPIHAQKLPAPPLTDEIRREAERHQTLSLYGSLYDAPKGPTSNQVISAFRRSQAMREQSLNNDINGNETTPSQGLAAPTQNIDKEILEFAGPSSN